MYMGIDPPLVKRAFSVHKIPHLNGDKPHGNYITTVLGFIRLLIIDRQKNMIPRTLITPHLFTFGGQALYFPFKIHSDQMGEWPFNTPRFVIINQPMGGNPGGRKGISDSLLPKKHYIDNIRYFKQ